MTQTHLHIAAQYLASAADLVLPKQEDDSHRNFAWNPITSALETHYFSDQHLRMVLSYEDFALFFVNQNNEILMEFDLGGSQHSEVMAWLIRTWKELNLHGNYRFHWPSNLPLDAIEESYTFPKPNEELFEMLEIYAEERTMAQRAMIDCLKPKNIRVWPHHFDTGALEVIEESEDGTLLKSISSGLSIADSMVNEDYCYVSFWSKDGGLELNKDLPCGEGEWIEDGHYQGAILRMIDPEIEVLKAFFDEAFQSLYSILTPEQ